jgi:hypothetical protein
MTYRVAIPTPFGMDYRYHANAEGAEAEAESLRGSVYGVVVTEVAVPADRDAQHAALVDRFGALIADLVDEGYHPDHITTAIRTLA